MDRDRVTLLVVKEMVGVVAVVRLVKILATYHRSLEVMAFWLVMEERATSWPEGSVPAYKSPLEPPSVPHTSQESRWW